MRPAALRLAIFAAFVPVMQAVTEPPARVAPTRPGATVTTARVPPSVQLAALPTTRIGGVEFVSMRDIAGLIGWKVDWIEPARRLILSDQTGRVEVTGGSREAIVNGLRLFLGNPAMVRSRMLYISKTDWQRSLMPLLRPALLGPLLARPRIIAIDPGHGGVDHGFENKPLGLKEKVLTLDVALRLKKLLESRGYVVVLTRSDDRQLGPDKQTDFLNRADITNRANADLFVSIHFNSLFPDTKTGGTEVYTFTRAGQRSDRAWGFGARDDAEPPSEVNRFDPWSSLLAHSMHHKVTSSLKTLDRGQKTMHLAVLRGLKCPAVLVESVFLSNDAEARRAATPAYLQQIAVALSDGIELYADTLQQIQPKPIPRASPPTFSSPP